jgi:hypothetical protein
MTINLEEYTNELPDQEKPTLNRAPQARRVGSKKKYQPDTDIVHWLSCNAPTNFQELVDLRYCLYHRCSRSGFTVKRWDIDDFNLTGRHGSLHIINNNARRFLLWQLRLLARERGWQGALPSTRVVKSGSIET